MQPMSKSTSAVLDFLTRDLADPCVSDARSSRKVDQTNGSYMAVHVERIGPTTYSIAHYYQKNGDLVQDPDVVFVREQGKWYPTEIQQPFGYSRVMRLDPEGKISGWSPKHYRDLRSFAITWIRNIREQQGIAGAVRAFARAA